VGEALRELVIGRRLPELLDEDARVARLHCVDGGQDRSDLVACLVGLPLDVELDERRMTVARDETGVWVLDGRDDVRDVRLQRERLDDARDRGVERRLVHRHALRLDEHALRRRDIEPALLQDPLCARGLAVRDVGVLQLLDGDCAAGERGDQGEREPAECGALPVRCAPAADPAGEVRSHRCLLEPSESTRSYEPSITTESGRARMRPRVSADVSRSSGRESRR